LLPCGLTIHPGTGCEWNCVYCYLHTMDFPAKAEPYRLTGEEILLSVVSNPYVAPGYTPLAFGSVTEPFLSQIRNKTLEYLSHLSRTGCPMQFSTKQEIDDDTADAIAEAGNSVNALISVTCTTSYERFEPHAPPPEKRLHGLARLKARGVPSFVFVRPVLPSVTVKDATEILELAESYGADGVVLGSLRATEDTVRALSALGVRIGIDIKGKRPTYVPCHDEMEQFRSLAERKGVLVLPSACSATMFASGRACYACSRGPCGDVNRLPEVDHEDVSALASALGERVDVVAHTDSDVVVRCPRVPQVLRAWVKFVLGRSTVVSRP